MQLVWDSPDGLTITEIWDASRRDRDVSRTTILNLVDRLEKRGWLLRRKDLGVFRYVAAVERTLAQSQLASDFVAEFFSGSAANLLMSLLGSQRVSQTELDRLKKLIEAKAPKSSRKAGE